MVDSINNETVQVDWRELNRQDCEEASMLDMCSWAEYD